MNCLLFYYLERDNLQIYSRNMDILNPREDCNMYAKQLELTLLAITQIFMIVNFDTYNICISYLISLLTSGDNCCTL